MNIIAPQPRRKVSKKVAEKLAAEEEKKQKAKADKSWYNWALGSWRKKDGKLDAEGKPLLGKDEEEGDEGKDEEKKVTFVVLLNWLLCCCELWGLWVRKIFEVDAYGIVPYFENPPIHC